MKKTRISREVQINSPKEKVWEVLSNFGDIYKASTGVDKSYLTSDQKTGVGTTRHCDLAMMGAEVEEKIIGWEEGRSMRIDMYKRKNLPLIKDFIADFEIREESGKTILRGIMEYSMTGVIGTIMNSIMMKKMNARGLDKVLAGYKKHIETGEALGRKSEVDLDTVRIV